jgi:undecaprenyl-diphosphatase
VFATVTVLQALILGLVQGLTEFLPISSSGHLVLAPELLGIPAPPLAFDVLLHLATAVAIAGYFVRELRLMLYSFVAPARLPEGDVKGFRRMTLWLLVGSIPAGIAGVAFGDFFESLFTSTLGVGIFLLVTSALLVGAELVIRSSAGRRRVSDMGLLDALIIGGFQALAIAPGLSRSGSTIAGGIFLGLDRATAARFSFLLAIPAIGGAGLLKITGMIDGIGEAAPAYLAGAGAALVAGVLTVHFLLRFLRTHGLWVFAGYTALLGALVIFLSLF